MNQTGRKRKKTGEAKHDFIVLFWSTGGWWCTDSCKQRLKGTSANREADFSIGLMEEYTELVACNRATVQSSNYILRSAVPKM